MKGLDSHSKPFLNLIFLGAAGDDVTGSATLLSIDINGEKRYGLVDAGGYQGKSNRNYYFPVNACQIEFVIITHAHYDHIGLLPKLYKDGFRGHIYITEQAKRQGNLILQDAANINLGNSEYGRCGGIKLNKTRRRYENKKKKAINCRDIKNIDSAIAQMDEIIQSPLYGMEDVEGLKSLYEVVKPNTLFSIYDDRLFAKMIPTTHQNGAVQVELYLKEDDGELGILFSGDIGPDNSLLYKQNRDFVNPRIDYALLESLHGVDDPLETLEESISKLEKIINDGIKNHKTVFLSGFSLDRDSMLVYLINRMKQKGMRFKAYFDAPMALKENSYYQEYYLREQMIRKKSSDEELLSSLWFKDLGDNPFGLEGFDVIKKIDEHTQLLNTSEPKVVITSSANGNGGRVVNFFDKFIQDPNAIFVFCGWIYPESPSQILHDANQGEIVDFGTTRYIKRCQTYRLHGLSSHGGLQEIYSLLYNYPKIKEVILNHGEFNSKKDVEDAIREEFDVISHIPFLYDAYSVSKDSIRKLEYSEMIEIFKPALFTFNMDYILAELSENEEEA